MAEFLALSGVVSTLLMTWLYIRSQKRLSICNANYALLHEEQHNVEQQFNDRERIFSLIYNHSSELMGLVSVEEESDRYLIVSLNNAYTAALQQYGIDISKETVIGLSIEEFCRKILHNSEDTVIKVRGRYKEVLQTKGVVEYEASSKLSNGQIIIMSVILSPIFDNDGRCTHIIDITRDITKRKQAEDSLRQANKRLSTLISNLPGVVYRCKNDEIWTVEFLSAGFKEMTGYDAVDFYGDNPPRQWGSLVHEEDEARTITSIKEAFDQKMPYQIIYRIINATKRIRWIWEQGREVYDEEGGVIWREGFMLDITDLTRAQERLVAALKERQHFIRKHNKMLEQKVHERTLKLEMQSEELGILNERLQKKNEELKVSEEELRQNGEELHASNDFLLKTQKILDQQNSELQETLQRLKDTQLQLVQSEKMATLGQLTAGLAHEINNPVNYIHSGIEGLKAILEDLFEILKAYETITIANVETELLRIETLKQELDYKEVLEGAHELIENIIHGAARTAEIVRELRTFSRLDESGLKYIDLHQSIDSTLVMLHSQYKNKIIIEKDYGDVPSVECYPGKLNQVFMNMLVNAIQAIENKGRIEIHTRVNPLNEKRIEIIIKDNGRGIPENIHHKIFEPFFTNKDIGEGTGLGLSISLSIIQLHHGEITMSSKENEGTVFTISLPITQKGKDEIKDMVMV